MKDVFMCKTATDIWQSLLITHQGNIQVKDNKIDLVFQQYEQFTILKEESINSDFVKFNTIITSLKALDEGFSSNNFVRKFFRALHTKLREKVTAIEESKDLSSLALDELIGNLKVHEVILEKDSKIYRGKMGNGLVHCLKAKKRSSDVKTLTWKCCEEYAVVVRNFKKFFRRKPPCNKDQKAFIGGSWSDSKNDAGDKTQVKDNKIDFLVQQYEQFTILEEESIDSGFARFNTIITSLKVHEVVMEKDSEIYRGKNERVKSIALKAKK
ncbi:hypothetical protein Tco_0466419 [Tanacetum coccineum]